MSNQEQPKRTASQRIDDLERGLMAMYQTADNMARDLMVAKDAIKLLGNKMDSVVKALQRQGNSINDELISSIMVENNIAELKEKVTNLVTQGILVASQELTDASFIVGRELNDAGEVVNPRMQFALNALGQELKDKIKAGKIGDVIVLQEGKLRFELQEVYSIQQPTQPEQAEAAPAAEAEQSSNGEAAAQGSES